MILHYFYHPWNYSVTFNSKNVHKNTSTYVYVHVFFLINVPHKIGFIYLYLLYLSWHSVFYFYYFREYRRTLIWSHPKRFEQLFVQQNTTLWFCFILFFFPFISVLTEECMTQSETTFLVAILSGKIRHIALVTLLSITSVTCLWIGTHSRSSSLHRCSESDINFLDPYKISKYTDFVKYWMINKCTEKLG